MCTILEHNDTWDITADVYNTWTQLQMYTILGHNCRCIRYLDITVDVHVYTILGHNCRCI